MADVFDSADDMRDFAANFFESFFFGGGFPGFKGGGGGGGGGGFRVETRREKNLRWEIDDDVV